MTPRNDDDWDGTERRREPSAHEIYSYIEKRLAEPGGLRIKTFSDINAALSIAAVLFGGIVWGSRLESKTEKLAEEQFETRRIIDHGMLPLTEERLGSLTARLDRREQEAEKALALIREIEKECHDRLVKK